MKKSIIFIFILLFCCIFASCNKVTPQNEITVKWLDPIYDESGFEKERFEYNGKTYIEIQTDWTVTYSAASDYWAADESRMSLLGQIKIWTNDKIAKPMLGIYHYVDLYAYSEEDEQYPELLYCPVHLWIREDLDLSKPDEALFYAAEKRSNDEKNANDRGIETEESFSLDDVLDKNSGDMVTRVGSKYDSFLRLYSEEYPCLFTELEIKDDKYCYMYFDGSKDVRMELTEKWQELLEEE